VHGLLQRWMTFKFVFLLRLGVIYGDSFPLESQTSHKPPRAHKKYSSHVLPISKHSCRRIGLPSCNCSLPLGGMLGRRRVSMFYKSMIIKIYKCFTSRVRLLIYGGERTSNGVKQHSLKPQFFRNQRSRRTKVTYGPYEVPNMNINKGIIRYHEKDGELGCKGSQNARRVKSIKMIS
jgi:hypothetical protein